MDDRDLEQRLAGYRPVVERAMARRPLAPRRGRDGRRLVVSAVAAATVAAGVVGWVALGSGDEPAGTGTVQTTDVADWPVADEALSPQEQYEALMCYYANNLGDGTITTEPDDTAHCVTVQFCAEGVDGAVTASSDELVPIELTTTDGAGVSTTRHCWITTPDPTVVAFGDSTMLGAAPKLEAAGITVVAGEGWDVGTVMERMPDVLRDQRPSAVVLQVGISGNLDAEAFETVMNQLDGVQRVVVLTVHGDRPWAAENNELIRALPAERPNVIVLDWDELAEHCVGECFATDEFHLTEAGAAFYTALITNLLDTTSATTGP